MNHCQVISLPKARTSLPRSESDQREARDGISKSSLSWKNSLRRSAYPAKMLRNLPSEFKDMRMLHDVKYYDPKIGGCVRRINVDFRILLLTIEFSFYTRRGIAPIDPVTN